VTQSIPTEAAPGRFQRTSSISYRREPAAALACTELRWNFLHLYLVLDTGTDIPGGYAGMGITGMGSTGISRDEIR
jgi:hypothetical protein